jgi:hypothetical protein
MAVGECGSGKGGRVALGVGWVLKRRRGMKHLRARGRGERQDRRRRRPPSAHLQFPASGGLDERAADGARQSATVEDDLQQPQPRPAAHRHCHRRSATTAYQDTEAVSEAVTDMDNYLIVAAESC